MSTRRNQCRFQRLAVAGISALTLLSPATASAQRSGLSRSPTNTRATLGYARTHAPTNMRRFGIGTSPLYSSQVRKYNLYRSYGFTSPVRRFAPMLLPNASMSAGAPATAPGDDLVGSTKKSIDDLIDQSGRARSQYLGRRLAGQFKQLTNFGWAYVHDGDYLRAIGSFEAAESVEPRAVGPLFGQAVAIAADEQFARAMHKLARLANATAYRPQGAPNLFEHEFSLRQALSGEDEVLRMIKSTRDFAQKNAAVPRAQALYAFILWYTRIPDAVIEARSIATRIRRDHPASPWAAFDPMMAEADEHARQAPATAGPQGDTDHAAGDVGPPQS